MYESSSASVEEATRTPAWYFKETLGNLRTPCANDNVYISHNYELLILI